MFRKFEHIISGKKKHCEKIYNEILAHFRPAFLGNMQASIFIGSLMQGSEKLFYNDKEAPLLIVDIHKMTVEGAMRLVELHGGLLRKYAQDEFNEAFEVLSNLSHKFFPQSSYETLELFDEFSPFLEYFMSDKKFFSDSWERICYAYAWAALEACPKGSKINEAALKHFVLEGKKQIWASIMTIAASEAFSKNSKKPDEDAPTELKIEEPEEEKVEVSDRTLANNTLLDLEIKALQYELADLKALRFEIEKDIKDFASRYDEELGELFLKLLEIRSKISEKAKKQAHETDAPTPETNDYNAYKENLDAVRTKPKSTLSPTEQAEIKKAFRMASKLCHPDIAAPANKEKANEIFIKLQKAYEENDLKTVLGILINLQNNGLDIEIDTPSLDKKNLQQKLESLKSEIATIRLEISKLQNSESYRTACSTRDLDSYFQIKKKEIEKEIQSLLSINGEL